MIYLYVWKKYSITVLPFISIAFVLLLSVLFTSIIEKRVQEPIPAWIKDPSLLPIIEKKQNVPYWIKYISSFPFLYSDKLSPFYSWNRLEGILNKLTDKISSKYPKIDVIVGIKSGGAICASYIHKKIPNTSLYFFKSKTNKNKDEGIINLIGNEYERYVQKKKFTMSVVEGITDDISNKTVLLIDEKIDTGQTILFAKEYLKKEKQVSNVICATINLNSEHYISSIDSESLIYYTNNEYVMIYPWGYDN